MAPKFPLPEPSDGMETFMMGELPKRVQLSGALVLRQFDRVLGLMDAARGGEQCMMGELPKRVQQHAVRHLLGTHA